MPVGSLVCCSNCGRDTENRNGICSTCLKPLPKKETIPRVRAVYRPTGFEEHIIDAYYEEHLYGPMSDEVYNGDTSRDDL